ncbi:MAG: sigma-54 dependent transcriptional regulator [Desulfobulbaceae bacterium]|nr:sigma-54 dependent transcriptional regulator [Desulfobulbaceae bacterium]
MAAEILVVDDDQALCGMLIEHLRRSGHQADGANTLGEGIKLARSHAYDVVFLDVQMPDGNGLDYLPGFKDVSSCPEVIIITGKGDPNGARQAISSGAWSYIEKPHVIRDLLLHLTRALQYREEKQRIKTVPVALKRDNIIGHSQQIKICLDQVAKAAACDASVLITGETGTGKEVFAQAVHENSNRANNNFVVVDCAALPENLIESTLFGHSRGAFTGADHDKDGLVKHADGGTLFLDEVGELPPAMQKSFLRVLQEHSYRPVGGTREAKSNFRVIAATNRDLAERVHNGKFRSDLLFRLQGIWIKLPPLREHIEDIKELTTYYIHKLCHRYGLDSKGIAPDFINALSTYHWPGNVRELFQTLENVMAEAPHHPTLFARHLPDHLRVLQAQAGIKTPTPALPSDPEITAADSLPPWRDYKEHFELSYIRKLLEQTDGNVSAACRISGLSRTRLYQLMKKFDISS